MSYFTDNYGGDGDDIDKLDNIESDDDDDNSSESTQIEGVEEEEEEIEEVDDDEDDDIEEDDDDIEEDDPMKGGADSDNELEEGEIDEEAEQKAKRVKKIPAKTVYKKPDIDDDDDDDDGEMYLQKFDQSVNDNYIVDFHPESVLQNYDEILAMIRVIRDKDGIIIDDLHKTIPYLTKYEKARILGQRAKQINSGATPFVKVPENVIDGYIIAELELKEKRIPFIIRRPLPNGGSEYWSIKDLEDISF
jgi:DNA-directed RNA polymerase subunit K/omega